MILASEPGDSAKDRSGGVLKFQKCRPFKNQKFIAEKGKSARGEPGLFRALIVKSYPEVGRIVFLIFPQCPWSPC